MPIGRYQSSRPPVRDCPQPETPLRVRGQMLDAPITKVRLSHRFCEGCRHFIPDLINPPAGLGGCAAGCGSHYPRQPHTCTSWKPQ